MMDDLITTTEAASMCGVGKSTISMWVTRGHLQVAGLDERDQPLYRVGAVMLTARDTRRRAVGAGRTA